MGMVRVDDESFATLIKQVLPTVMGDKEEMTKAIAREWETIKTENPKVYAAMLLYSGGDAITMEGMKMVYLLLRTQILKEQAARN